MRCDATPPWESSPLYLRKKLQIFGYRQEVTIKIYEEANKCRLRIMQYSPLKSARSFSNEVNHLCKVGKGGDNAEDERQWAAETNGAAGRSGDDGASGGSRSTGGGSQRAVLVRGNRGV